MHHRFFFFQNQDELADDLGYDTDYRMDKEDEVKASIQVTSGARKDMTAWRDVLVPD